MKAIDRVVVVIGKAARRRACDTGNGVELEEEGEKDVAMLHFLWRRMGVLRFVLSFSPRCKFETVRPILVMMIEIV